MYYTDLSPQTLQEVTGLDQSTHLMLQFEVISGQTMPNNAHPWNKEACNVSQTRIVSQIGHCLDGESLVGHELLRVLTPIGEWHCRRHSLVLPPMALRFLGHQFLYTVQSIQFRTILFSVTSCSFGSGNCYRFRFWVSWSSSSLFVG